MAGRAPFLPSVSTVAYLCGKEWRALFHDTVLMFLVAFAFTFMIYSQATGISTNLKHAPVGVVDEDRSPLSYRFADALLPPYFGQISYVSSPEAERGLDEARYSFVLHFPAHMEADLRAGKNVTAQLLIDATLIGQAQIGAGYIQSILRQELLRSVNAEGLAEPAVGLTIRYAFNQGQESSWFMAITGMIQNITMLAVLLTGAALIRERESGTIEHLLVMPVTALEIVLSKVIANGAVILAAAFLAIELTIRRVLHVDIHGSVPLFLFASALYLFFTTGLGLFLGTVARSMPQMGLMFILIVLPMNLLSGGYTPLESEPEFLQKIMGFVPSTNYIKLAQAILFRDAGVAVVWPELAMVTVVGLIFFAFSVMRFRDFLGRQS